MELALERNHDVAGVLREARDGVKRRDDQALRGGEHGHDGKLGGAAVVELDVEAALLRLLVIIDEEVKRVVEVEEELRALAHERRVVARDSARLGVVRDLSRDLAVGLEHADEDKDLELADHRDVVPLLLRGHVLDEATVREGRVGALDNVEGLHAEAEERSHWNGRDGEIGQRVGSRRLNKKCGWLAVDKSVGTSPVRLRMGGG